MAFAFPDSLTARLVADEAFGAAYDALAPEERALIKTAVARSVAALSLCACPEPLALQTAQTMRQGFVLHERTAPADWAFICIDETVRSPALVLGALLPAMLSGTAHIALCRVAEQERADAFPTAVLAALELAGQETAARLSADEAAACIEECASMSGRGRIVVVGGGNGADALARLAGRQGIPARRFAGAVRIGIDAASLPEDFSRNESALRFAHPDAEFVPVNGSGGRLDAVYCGAEAVAAYLAAAPFVFSPGQEACWLWPDMGAAFFQATSRGLASGSEQCL